MQLWNRHKQREAEFQEQKEFVDQWKVRNIKNKSEEERVKKEALAKAKAMQEALKKQMVGPLHLACMRLFCPCGAF
jgi:hypothetical protein